MGSLPPNGDTVARRQCYVCHHICPSLPTMLKSLRKTGFLAAKRCAAMFKKHGYERHPPIDNCELFAAYAKNRPRTWKKIEGHWVTHVTFGRGMIVRVGPGKHSNTMYIWVRFDKGKIRQFPRSLLGNRKFFSNLTLPSDLHGIKRVREQLLQRKREEEQRRKLAEQAAQRLGKKKTRKAPEGKRSHRRKTLHYSQREVPRNQVERPVAILPAVQDTPML